MKKCQSIFLFGGWNLGLKVAEHGEDPSIIKHTCVDNLFIIFKFGENVL